MATIARTMSGMDERRGVIANSVYGRVALVLLGTLSFAAGMTLLFVLNAMWLPVTLKFTSVIAVALVAGGMARRLLREHSMLWRVAVAAFAFVCALALLYRLTQGYIGIEMAWGGEVDAVGDKLKQLGLGALGIGLALKAWHRRVQIVPYAEQAPSSSGSVASPRPTKIKTKTASATPRLKLGRPAVLTIAFWAGLWAARPRLSLAPIKAAALRLWQLPQDWLGRLRSRGKVRVKARGAKRKAKETNRSGLRAALGRKPKKAVQLSSAVSHVCPYCLEPVVPGDPRGVTTCKICGTPHHADCWDVTGVCQVPHQHE